MVGLDTNVLARYIVQDEPEQAAAAARLIEGRDPLESPGFVSVPVLLELVWVLASAYGCDKTRVVQVIRQVLRTAEFAVEDRPVTWAALRDYESGAADFADYVIAHRNRASGCTQTWTFDRRAARGAHFTLLN